jgi:hypothetical protein
LTLRIHPLLESQELLKVRSIGFSQGDWPLLLRAFSPSPVC